MLAVLQFHDSELESEPFIVETELSEEELQKKVDEVKEKLEFDWTYDDLVQELERMGVIRVVESRFYRVYA